MSREAIDTWMERTILVLVVGVLGFAVVALGAVFVQELPARRRKLGRHHRDGNGAKQGECEKHFHSLHGL